MGFAADADKLLSPPSPLVRSTSSAAILGVRSGGIGSGRDQSSIISSLLQQMSVDDKVNIKRRASLDDLYRSDLGTPQMNNRR